MTAFSLTHPEPSKPRAGITPMRKRSLTFSGIRTWGVKSLFVSLCLVLDPSATVVTPDYNCCHPPSLGEDSSGGDCAYLHFLETCLDKSMICQFPVIT